MADDAYRFDRFLLDPEDRQLRLEGAPIDLNARYLDALTLLVREQGRLISKDRFLDEIWRGVPVTEEALTQCIRSLRRRLGDDAARPRFIETVPKHGYRFIAPVIVVQARERQASEAALTPCRAAPRAAALDEVLRTGRAAMAGGGAAGLVGGLAYGVVGVSDLDQSGGGGASAVLVIACLTAIVGLLGGTGVGFGIATSRFASTHRGLWGVLGGAVGGMVIGAVVKLVGIDAFNLLFGQSPGDITGAPEGAILGGMIGIAVWAAGRSSATTAVVIAGLLGVSAGVLISVGGGRLMGGSLDLLSARFPESHLSLGHLGAFTNEAGFGPRIRIVTAGLEGLLFGGAVVAAILMQRRRPAGP